MARKHPAGMKFMKGRALWAAMHGSKVIYETEAEAAEHRDIMILSYPKYWFIIYQCRWGKTYEYGESEPMHWHVGRRIKPSWNQV